MAAYDFAVDLTIDGESFLAARGQQGERQVAIQYVPKIRASSMNAVGDPTLDPLEYTTFHRGAGASRSVGVNGMVGYCENGWTVDPGVFMPGPEVTSIALPGATAPPRPDATAEADGNVFVVTGRYVYRIPNGSGAPVQDLDLGAGHVGYALKRFGTSLFLANDGALYERPDGGVWTNGVLGLLPVTPSGALGTVWWTTGPSGSQVTAERLLAQFGTRGLRYCTLNPRLDTNWTPAIDTPGIDIGDPITRIVTSQDHAYIATDRGLHDLDVSGMSPNLIPEAEFGHLSTGGLAALIKSGIGYCSGGYELYRVSVAGQSYAMGETVTPMALLPNETPAGGYGTALVTRGQYLIYAMYDPVLDTTWVCWGREANSAQQSAAENDSAAPVRGTELGPYVWNVAPIVLHGFKVTALHVTGLPADGPRLIMIGQGPKTAPSIGGYWAPLAYTTPYADLKAGRPRRFAQSCFVVLPSEDGGQDAILKDIEEIQNEAENLSGGNFVKVSAAKEGESLFTTLATFTTGPRVVLPVSSAFITQRPTFRIDMGGTPLSPPILRRSTIRWLPNPDQREVRRYMLQLGSGERYASGNRSLHNAEDQVAHLIDLAEAAARVTMSVDGKNLVVRILKVDGPAEVQTAPDGDRVLALAVTLSVFGRAPGPPFQYDVGITYDSDHSWS